MPSINHSVLVAQRAASLVQMLRNNESQDAIFQLSVWPEEFVEINSNDPRDREVLEVVRAIMVMIRETHLSCAEVADGDRREALDLADSLLAHLSACAAPELSGEQPDWSPAAIRQGDRVAVPGGSHVRQCALQIAGNH